MSHTVHTIPVTEKTTSYLGHDLGHYACKATILVAGSNNRAGWGVSGWGANGTGRIVFQGPKVQGPHASLFGLATVIAGGNGTKADQENAEAAGLLFRVNPGDVLDIDGTCYTVSLCRRRYPVLTRIEAADDSEALARWGVLYGEAL